MSKISQERRKAYKDFVNDLNQVYAKYKGAKYKHKSFREEIKSVYQKYKNNNFFDYCSSKRRDYLINSYSSFYQSASCLVSAFAPTITLEYVNFGSFENISLWRIIVASLFAFFVIMLASFVIGSITSVALLPWGKFLFIKGTNIKYNCELNVISNFKKKQEYVDEEHINIPKYFQDYFKTLLQSIAAAVLAFVIIKLLPF